MMPSVQSTGELTWHAAASNWPDNQSAAATAVGRASSATSCGGTGAAAADSCYHNLHRCQILDWENAMLPAQQDAVYDQVVDDTKPAGMSRIHADTLASLSHVRHHENLLSADVQQDSNSRYSMGSHSAWGLLNTVCYRNSGAQHQDPTSSFLLQAPSAAYNYEDSIHDHGAEEMGACRHLSGSGSFYADPFRSSASGSSTSATMQAQLGLTYFDQTARPDDTVKRDLYTTHDVNSRLGLDLGGRTYFSADDFALARWGKQLRPNSRGCMLQPAPLCQAEGCRADLSMAKHYHRRHKVCEYHSKAAMVRIGEQTQRFCQQCSRFHVLGEFDDGKRSCRKRLADHNRRRRKLPPAAPTLAIEAASDHVALQDCRSGSDNLQNGSESNPLNAGESWDERKREEKSGSPCLSTADTQELTTT